MKLQLYDEDGIVDGPPVTLRLGKALSMDNCLSVRVVNQNGDPVEGGCLAIFTPEGRIIRPVGVDPKFGFVLDEQGRVAELLR